MTASNIELHFLRSRGALALLGGLVAVRVTIPLIALAASGHKLPDLPRYDYVPLTGDATGFYAAAREFIASWARLGAPTVILLALGLVAFVALLVHVPLKAARAIVLATLGFVLAVTPAVWKMHESGAAVLGWSLLWSLPMLPYRALGGPLDPDIAFAFGLPLALAANAVTVVATAFAGFYATGRRAVALGAAALFSLWPLLTGLIAGPKAWENGTWTVDAGLALYTEPISTALVAVAVALLLSPRLTDVRLASAGVLLGLATLVKLTNCLLAVAALLFVAWRVGPRRALPYLGGALTFVPLVAVYWPKGYATHFDEAHSWPRHPFSVDYVVTSWSDSLLFGPRMLLLLGPLAVIGAVALRSPAPRVLLVAWALVNPIFYSFYRATWEHPRFLFASLPAAFCLWALGAAIVIEAALLQRRRGDRYTAQSPARTRR